ncbi:MAG TPA: hypothetical protein VGB94_04225 [Acidobacteriaceae bacterium]
MDIWYIIFSLIALPAVLMVFLPKDTALLEGEEAATPQLAPVHKAEPKPAPMFGRMPYHEYQPMPSYRIFHRAPLRNFF